MNKSILNLKTMRISYFKLTLLFFYITFPVIISGCSTHASLGGPSPSRCGITIDYAEDTENQWPDQKLEDAFCKYWTLRYTGNIQQTYSMEAPQFKDQVSIEKYELYVRRTKNNTLEKIVINDVGKKSSDLTHIDCNFFLKTKSDNGPSSSIRDKWIRIEGEWFHAMRDPFFFPIVYE
ncbi:MAG: hypothetical protein PF482_00935 [Desulfobacteraceae bacterium]|jgi:hypothetical protein|nr:hypothetical protein [Desulfobacteraceae bacterium]